ncbi:MAG: peptidase [Candidatus Nomurabacteria bacterium]|nr:peptidase [Candidatus Nomurabacteria bacterium]
MNEALTMSAGILPIIIVIFSIILHEVAHGYAAYVQGDETAYRAGRLTLNPLPHIDMVGSVIVPFLTFFTGGWVVGWAKPVPYNVYNIRSKIGQAFVAAAGVLTNLLIAIIAGIFFKAFSTYGIGSSGVFQGLYTIILVNVSLAFFNLIPIPPFDGMSIIQAIFPRFHIKSALVYNPFYMILAIVIASVLYTSFMPYVFSAVIRILG